MAGYPVANFRDPRDRVDAILPCSDFHFMVTAESSGLPMKLRRLLSRGGSIFLDGFKRLLYTGVL